VFLSISHSDKKKVEKILPRLYQEQLLNDKLSYENKAIIYSKIFGFKSNDPEANLFLARHYTKVGLDSKFNRRRIINHYSQFMEWADKNDDKNGKRILSEDHFLFASYVLSFYIENRKDKEKLQNIKESLSNKFFKRDFLVHTLYKLYELNINDSFYAASKGDLREMFFHYDPIKLSGEPIINLINDEIKLLGVKK